MRSVGSGPLVPLIVGIAVVAFNMRTAVTSVGPVLPALRRDLVLSNTLASFLTALPLICFAVCSPVVPWLMRRFGPAPLLAGTLAVLGAGLSLRAAPTAAAVIGGTAVVGAALAVTNVTLPVLIKRDAPEQAGLITGMYTMIISVGAALGAGVTVPFATAVGGGWQAGLALWALPVIPAVGYWAMRAARPRPLADEHESGPRLRLFQRRFFQSPVTWAVTCFFGLQSGVFYAAIGWLPSMLHDQGVTIAEAGGLVSLALVVGIPTGLVAPVVAVRRTDQRRTITVFVVLAASGLLGLLLAPGAAVVWMILFGMGIGGTFPLALMLMVIMTENPHETRQLSSLAQTFGYTLAIAGPFAVGELHGLTGSWTLPLGLMTAVMFGPTLLAGLAAARRR